MGFTDVLRPQACSEAILARVGQKQTFWFLLVHRLFISPVPWKQQQQQLADREFLDNHNGSENLLPP